MTDGQLNKHDKYKLTHLVKDLILIWPKDVKAGLQSKLKTPINQSMPHRMKSDMFYTSDLHAKYPKTKEKPKC